MKQSLPYSSIAALRSLWSGLVALCVLLPPGQSRADTLIYLSDDGFGEGAAPVASQTLKFLPGGGSFHIWVQPDTLFTGISLDVDRGGSAIEFTDVTVHNPMVGTDSRWLSGLIREDGASASKVSRIEGGALAPLTGFGTGIGPTTASSDPLYESGSGFLFATIDFTVPNPTQTATATLAVGHNLLSDTGGLTTSTIIFGLGDTAVTNSSGSTGSAVDLSFEARPLHPSDFDVDGDVDGDDLLAWQDGFGITSGALKSQGDANADGIVNADDLTVWESQYSTVPPGAASAATAVPEAASACLAVTGMVSLLATRPRKRP